MVGARVRRPVQMSIAQVLDDVRFFGGHGTVSWAAEFARIVLTASYGKTGAPPTEKTPAAIPPSLRLRLRTKFTE